MKVNLIYEITGDFIRGAARSAAQTRGKKFADEFEASHPPYPEGPHRDTADYQGSLERDKTIARGENLVKLNKLRRSARFWRNTKKRHDAEIADQGFVRGRPKEEENEG